MLHPFLTFTYLMRGIDIPSILIVLLIDLLAVLLSTQAALFVAVIPVPRVLKVLLFFFGFIALCWMYAGAVVGTGEFIRRGVSDFFDSEFWVGMGLTTLAVLLGTAQLACWSVGLISPPSANRALVGRVFLVFTWLILGVGCLAVSLMFWSLVPFMRGFPMAVWTSCSVLLFCLQLLISINERDSWGPRVTRTIPRWPLLRLLAFLFYSGAAGGVLLSVICIALTLLTAATWQDFFFGGATDPRGDEDLVQIFSAIALYTFCYGMSAVLLRAYLFANRILSVFTWVLALLLFALGCTVPWIFAMLANSGQLAYTNRFAWWWLPNPFMALSEIEGYRYRNNTDFVYTCFLFLGVWAVVLCAAAVPWVFQQLRRFRRLTPRVRSREIMNVDVPEIVEPFTPVQAR